MSNDQIQFNDQVVQQANLFESPSMKELLPKLRSPQDQVNAKAGSIAGMIADGSMMGLENNIITEDLEAANRKGGTKAVDEMVYAINQSLRAKGSSYRLELGQSAMKTPFARAYDIVGADGNPQEGAGKHLELYLPPTRKAEGNEKKYDDGSTVRSNDKGLMTEMKDAKGQTFKFGYDENGKVNSFTRPDGKTFKRQGEDSNKAVWINEDGDTHAYGQITTNAERGSFKTERQTAIGKQSRIYTHEGGGLISR